MIAGDDSHKRLQGEVRYSIAEAMGLADMMFPGRPGNPDNDDDWYPLDWMDTARAQHVLSLQRHSTPTCLPRSVPGLAGSRVRCEPSHTGDAHTDADQIAVRQAARPLRQRVGRIRHRWGDPEPDTPPKCLSLKPWMGDFRVSVDAVVLKCGRVWRGACVIRWPVPAFPCCGSPRVGPGMAGWTGAGGSVQAARGWMVG